jgi:hypothetical protein
MSGLKSYATGAVASLGYGLVSGFTGNGLIGSAVAAGVSSAVLKGTQAEVVATMLGFQAARDMSLGGMFGGGGGDGGSGIVDL